MTIIHTVNPALYLSVGNMVKPTRGVAVIRKKTNLPKTKKQRRCDRKKLSNQIITEEQEMKEIFEQIEQEYEKQSKFIKLESGQKKTLKFDVSKEGIQLKEVEFDGRKAKRVNYLVTEPGSVDVKTLSMAISHANSINPMLNKGFTTLEIKRIGTGKETKYTFVPA